MCYPQCSPSYLESLFPVHRTSASTNMGTPQSWPDRAHCLAATVLSRRSVLRHPVFTIIFIPLNPEATSRYCRCRAAQRPFLQEDTTQTVGPCSRTETILNERVIRRSGYSGMGGVGRNAVEICRGRCLTSGHTLLRDSRDRQAQKGPPHGPPTVGNLLTRLYFSG